MFSLKHCPFVFFYPGQGDNFSPKKKKKKKKALCGILGSDESELPPEARVQAGLAVRRGGLGIRWAVDHSEAAVLAAMSGTHDLCRKLDQRL